MEILHTIFHIVLISGGVILGLCLIYIIYVIIIIAVLYRNFPIEDDGGDERLHL
jgi:hypothetical protein